MSEATNHSYRSDEDLPTKLRKRYSTTTEPRTPTASSPTSPNGHGGLPILSPNNLSFTDDDVFFDEKLKENNNDLPHFAPPPRTPGTAPSPDVMWSQRKLRLRHVIVVAVLVALLILLAVGVGLAIVFTQNVSSDPTSTSPPPPSVITYNGSLQLESPWLRTRQELQNTLSQDFSSIVENSLLENHYRGTTLQDHSPQETQVDFVLNFSPDVTSLVKPVSRDPVREFIQTELRQLLTEKDTQLVIIPETLTLLDNIPVSTTTSSTVSTSLLPSTSTTSSSSPTTTTTTSPTTTESSSSTSSTTPSTTSTTSTPSSTSTTVTSPTTPSTTTSTTTVTSTTSTTTTTGPTTTTVPLPDYCLPLDFAPCQSLGYTHYSFPNLFGSETLEDAEYDFYLLSNDSFASGCTSDPTFFCGFAFPPCSAEMAQTLPCSDVCHTTMSLCSAYMPFEMDCQGYPTEPPCLQSPFPPVTTTPAPEWCSQQTYGSCKSLGFNSTYYPTWFADNETRNVEVFEEWAKPGIDSGCHPQMEFFMCATFFPRCSEEHGNVTMPCRSFCQEVQDACYGKGDKLNIDCEIFLDDPSKCLSAPATPTTTTTSTTSTTTTVTTTPVMSTTPFKEECRPISIEWCRHFGHVNGSAPNIWGSSDESQTLQLFTEYGQPVVSTGCSPSAFFYICAVLFPNCDGDEAVSFYPCKSVCEDYNVKCANETGFFEQQCDVLGTVAEDPYCLLPPSKAVCKPDEFACEGVPRCISSSLVCDRKDDCGDFSDERNCDCNADFEFQCNMGLCVRNYKRCDNNTDCPDHSDERGCSHCRNNQFKCNDGTCIMAEWVCDGLSDCPVSDPYLDLAEDEENCSVCSFTDDFTCISGECIPWEQKCDGTPQCKDHTDEANCIHQGPPTFVNIDGDVTPICATNFTAKHADVACHRLGMSGAITWKQLLYEDFPYLWFQVAENGTVKTVIGTGTLVDSCDGPFAVELICAPSECGKRQTSVNIITDGMDARPREVPWQASIQEFGKHFCGASLFIPTSSSPQLTVSSEYSSDGASIFSNRKYIMNFEYVEIVLGAVDLKAKDEAGRRTFTVKRIISHPEYLTFQGNDIALIELTSNVTFSADIQPLCLRRPGDVFTRASECYTAGWGKMDPNSNAMATKLQLVKMTVWDTNKCNSSFAWDGQLQDTEICAGYYAGIKAACRGDSGGPLYCFDNDFTWRLVGVASYVHVGCNKPEKPVVFTDAVRYNDWIANNTVCEFQCASGRCLFDRNMVCNKVDDCGDNSDETDPCDVSPNCTFDDPYLCGYRTNWLWVSDSLLANRYPLFDYSVGRYPGMFLLGAFRGHNLQTPRIDLTAPHCMRFRYHMRGTIAQGLAVHAHELSRKKWKKVWHEEPQEGPDRWLLGQFDLEAGNYDIAFRAYDDGVATLDDTQLLPGRCRDHGCGVGEFACNTSGVWNCLADAQRCNNVIDCDDASDELTCTASSYKCDFENGVLCSLEQNSFDSTAGEWHLINASRAGFDDVTFANGTGNMLRIVTERLLKTDFVYMEQDLYLGGQNHCLSFSYYSTSTIQFTVLFIPKEGRNYAENAEVILSFENRQTSGWSKTHASLPAKVEGHLYYEVVGRELNRSVIHPMVALDDITITPGACPVLTCPAGQTVCSTEAYCLDDSRFCDSHIDCLDAADEVNCVCNDKQYKCPDGPCIAKEKTCDHVTDCPDASDEGSECDSLRAVSCDFEHPFMCGYTDNGTRSEDAPYIWTREHTTPRGEPINVGTGPRDDHTFGNGSGHWAFANGENGHPYQYVALESPPFSSTGNDVLVFYYYAYSMFSRFWTTGSLGLLTRDHERSTEIQPWFIIVDGNHTWRSACVSLPQSSNLTVAFVAMRGEAQRADLAVDDVQFLQTTCEEFYKESRLTAGAATGPPEPTTAPPSGCPSGERACRSGMCLPESDFCNGYPDCPDGFDEICDNEG